MAIPRNLPPGLSRLHSPKWLRISDKFTAAGGRATLAANRSTGSSRAPREAEWDESSLIIGVRVGRRLGDRCRPRARQNIHATTPPPPPRVRNAAAVKMAPSIIFLAQLVRALAPLDSSLRRLGRCPKAPPIEGGNDRHRLVGLQRGDRTSHGQVGRATGPNTAA